LKIILSEKYFENIIQEFDKEENTSKNKSKIKNQ